MEIMTNLDTTYYKSGILVLPPERRIHSEIKKQPGIIMIVPRHPRE